MTRPRWELVVDIYEAATPDYAILTHVFRGVTKAECEGYYRAHLGTDGFLRDCVTKRRWRDVDCRATVGWRRLR